MSQPFEGRRVAFMVALLVMLTAVIPPVAAYALAYWRVRSAAERAESAASMLGSRRDDLRRIANGQDTICGPGRMPGGAGTGLGWVSNPVAAGPTLDRIWPQDPWGRCYLLDVASLLRSGSGLLISAGPNAVIETPLSASAATGDDIAVLVR